ncbi:MAG: ATP-binding protein, partial [Chloroflexia bacterium]|nr:ATP-binding protein [Chloroflexia bacterium]
MLNFLHLKHFTVFADATFKFGRHLNVFVGENGSGKSHVLKVAYIAIAVSAQRAAQAPTETPTKSFLETALADKLRTTFRPDDLGRLARRTWGHSTCDVSYEFDQADLNLAFRFSTSSKSKVTVTTLPTVWVDKLPVFLPTRELLTIYPGFVSLYETSQTQFDETWRDTSILLGTLLARGPREQTIKSLLEPLEAAMGGTVELDKAGRFYLKTANGKMEMHLVAEGLRKLAMLARLIATGALLDKGFLFWDEPEANLNPRIVKAIAQTILHISQHGIQVFIATHSLFLLRELYLLQQQQVFPDLDARYFGLHFTDDDAGVSVTQGATIDEIGDIS